MTPCLLVQIVAGAKATRADWVKPFSGAQETARFIESRYPRDTLLLGSIDFVTEAVAGELDRGMQFLETGDFGESVVAHTRRFGVTPDSMLSVVKDNLAERERVVIVLNYPMSAHDPQVTVKRVFSSAPSPIVADERFWVYEVTPAAPAPHKHPSHKRP